MLLRAGIVASLLLVLIYGTILAWPLLTGPSLTITSPVPGQTFADGQTTITGVAHHTETLWLNGGPLLIDEDGNFSATLSLPEGGAILSLTATDRFGRETTERRAVLVRYP